MRLVGLYCVVLLGLIGLATGCAADNRPVYKSPERPDSELAIVRGDVGMLSGMSAMLEEVDGSRCDLWAIGPVAPTYKLTPGEHECVAQFVYQTRNYRRERKKIFKHTFIAGHTYQLSIKSPPFDERMRLVDLTSKQELVLEETGK
jgi:hypothetical protein